MAESDSGEEKVGSDEHDSHDFLNLSSSEDDKLDAALAQLSSAEEEEASKLLHALDSSQVARLKLALDEADSAEINKVMAMVQAYSKEEKVGSGSDSNDSLDFLNLSSSEDDKFKSALAQMSSAEQEIAKKALKEAESSEVEQLKTALDETVSADIFEKMDMLKAEKDDEPKTIYVVHAPKSDAFYFVRGVFAAIGAGATVYGAYLGFQAMNKDEISYDQLHV